MSGADIAARVAAGIAKATAATGDGEPLAGVILRSTGDDLTTYPPTEGGETEYACSVMLTNFTTRDRNGTQIKASDIKMLVSPDAESDPRNGDRIRVSGKTYDLVNVDAVKPGGTVLMWKCQARAADE